MEVKLDSCLRPLGPRARAACTPVLVEVEDGERRFVVDDIGLGVMRLGGLMAGNGDGGRGDNPLHWGRDTRERE